MSNSMTQTEAKQFNSLVNGGFGIYHFESPKSIEEIAVDNFFPSRFSYEMLVIVNCLEGVFFVHLQRNDSKDMMIVTSKSQLAPTKAKRQLDNVASNGKDTQLFGENAEVEVIAAGAGGSGLTPDEVKKLIAEALAPKELSKKEQEQQAKAEAEKAEADAAALNQAIADGVEAKLKELGIEAPKVKNQN